MARRRMIDPNIWESEDVARLSLLARLLLIGMFSNADDEGRGRANPAYLRSTVFKYDEVDIADIRSALDSIVKWIRITVYEVDGQAYYTFDKWTKWQRVDKPTPSILPPPPSQEQFDVHTKTQSKNGSQNDSKNNSRLKEEKVREEKVREQHHAPTREDDAAADDIPDPLDPTPSDPIEAAVQQVLREFIPCGLSEPVPRIADEIETMMILPEYGLDPPTRSALVVRAMQAVKDLDKDKRHWGTVKGLIRHWQKNGERPPGGKQPTPSNRLFDNYLDGG